MQNKICRRGEKDEAIDAVDVDEEKKFSRRVWQGIQELDDSVVVPYYLFGKKDKLSYDLGLSTVILGDGEVATGPVEARWWCGV